MKEEKEDRDSKVRDLQLIDTNYYISKSIP